MECNCKTIHHDVVNKVKGELPKETVLFEVGEFFKVLGDSTRIRILFALSKSEMCVCDIANLLAMTHSAISHQLRLLKSSKFVKSRKEGKVVYYSLADEHISSIMELGLIHISE